MPIALVLLTAAPPGDVSRIFVEVGAATVGLAILARRWGLGVSAGLEPRLGSLSAAYVLLLAVAGPLLARFVGTRGER